MNIFENNEPVEQNQIQTLQDRSVLHDICVKDVKLICKQDIDFIVPIPAQSGGQIPGSCRGELIPLDPNTTCSVSVICGEEGLKTSCLGVDLQVGFQIVLTPPNPALCPTMVINHYADFQCTSYLPFPTGSPVYGAVLREALKTIDGSCIVVQNLSCEILDGQCARVRVTGELIDKLWKNENLIVLAFKPYGGVTIDQEFPEPHKLGDCVPCSGL